jgi:hypothetical protein
MYIDAVWIEIQAWHCRLPSGRHRNDQAPLRATGLTKTAAVEALLLDHCPDQMRGMRHRMDAILAQIDRIPELPEPSDPLDWDEPGLPR